MTKVLFIFPLLASLLLPGCATATRGGTTNFIIETSPVGAHVETSVQVSGKTSLSRYQIRQIQAGNISEPELEYKFCEPTPCGIEMPRKSEFEILITKEGYQSQIHAIGHKHRKEIQRETAKNAVLAGGTTAAAGTVGAAALASSFGTGLTVGGVATGVAVLAAPALTIGLVSLGVDASTGANYDIYPNPTFAELVALKDLPETAPSNEAIRRYFLNMRRERKLTPPPTIAESRQLAREESAAKAENRRQARIRAREEKKRAQEE